MTEEVQKVIPVQAVTTNDNDTPDELAARKPYGKIVTILVFFALVFAVWHFGLRNLLSLESIQNSAAGLKEYTQTHQKESMLAFVGAYIVLLCLFIPVAVLFDLLGGFLFGTWTGGGLILAAAGIGASIIFLITRTVLGEGLRARAGPLYTAAAKEIHSGAIFYLLFLRLVPGIPFALANVIPALLHIPFFTFLWTTVVGIAPVTFIIANLGQTLASIHSLHDLFSAKLALALTLLGVMALIPVILKKIKARKT